jgi:predicted nucleotidyltransferase
MPTASSGVTGRDAATLDQVRALVIRSLGAGRAVVYLFGSWATGRRHGASDIDVAIEAAEPLAPGLLARLREALEESTIPYRVDVVDLADTDPAFRERVRREGVVWTASANG